MAQGSVGRPRDETIERRVLQETVRQFGRRGWSNLTVARIASTCGVGKASIYLRWTSKEDLVLAAMELFVPRPSAVGTGTLQGDLTVMAQDLMEVYFSDVGPGIQRFTLDVDFPDAVGEKIAEFRRRQIRSWRMVVDNAVGNGWLREDTSVSLVLNVIHGAVWSYVGAGRGDRDRASESRFIDGLVGMVIACYGA